MAKFLRLFLEGFFCLAILVLPRRHIFLKENEKDWIEATLKSGIPLVKRPDTPAHMRYIPWCCRDEEPVPLGSQNGSAHVLYAADGGSFAPLAHSVISLARSLRADYTQPLTVHWVVRSEDMERARMLQDCLRRAIESLPVKPSLELHELLPHFHRLDERARARMRNQMAFVRFYMHEYLPSAQKVLWLDADTIVQSDIRQLYAMQMKNIIAAACHEGHNQTTRVSLMDELFGRLKHPDACQINTGVMLVDIPGWIGTGVIYWLEAWMNAPEIYMSTSYRLMMDQAIVNLHFDPGWIDILDQRWNVFHVGLYAEPIPECCLRHAHIFHFCWAGKPWEQGGGLNDYIYNAHSPPKECEVAMQPASAPRTDL